MMLPNPYAIIAALVLWIGTGAGAWFYRAHLDAGDVQAARAVDALASEAAVKKARDEADARTAALQAATDTRASDLQRLVDSSRNSYAKLKSIRMPVCPVAVADVGLLIGPASSGGSSANANTGSGTGNQDGGTVDARAIIEACELNRGAFERNAARLSACISSYDAARTIVNGDQK